MHVCVFAYILVWAIFVYDILIHNAHKYIRAIIKHYKIDFFIIIHTFQCILKRKAFMSMNNCPYILP